MRLELKKLDLAGDITLKVTGIYMTHRNINIDEILKRV